MLDNQDFSFGCISLVRLLMVSFFTLQPNKQNKEDAQNSYCKYL